MLFSFYWVIQSLKAPLSIWVYMLMMLWNYQNKQKVSYRLKIFCFRTKQTLSS